jgi:hypothetical protein
MTNERSFHEATNQQGYSFVLFTTQTATETAKLLTAIRQFLSKRRSSIKQWVLTLSILNTESHWQQILASWHDIQTGNMVSATEAFADIELLEETEVLFNG